MKTMMLLGALLFTSFVIAADEVILVSNDIDRITFNDVESCEKAIIGMDKKELIDGTSASCLSIKDGFMYTPHIKCDPCKCNYSINMKPYNQVSKEE